MKHDAPAAGPAAPITDDFVEDVAKTIHGDPRSVIRRLAGLPVRGRRGEAIDRELVARGITPSGPRAA
ncbi:MAG: hypothetical protein U0270_07715 [Labilithrix sp.]